MCGQRSSVATMPVGRVGEQDVEVAAADAAHRARRQVGDVEDRPRTARVGPCRAPGASAGTARVGGPSAAMRTAGRTTAPAGSAGAVECEEERRVSRRRRCWRRPARARRRTGAAAGRGRPATGAVVGRPERDLLDRDGGDERHDRRRPRRARRSGRSARLKAPWMPSTIAAMNGSTAAWNCGGTAARIAAPRSPTPVSELKSNAPLALACPKPAMTCCGTPGGGHLRDELVLRTSSPKIVPDEGERDRAADLAEERQVARSRRRAAGTARRSG